jgi:hypothetical protein
VPTNAGQPQTATTATTAEADNGQQPVFDLDTLTPEQRALYERGKRINAMMVAIQAKYPEGDPLDKMEAVMDVVLPMDKAQLVALMMDTQNSNF